MVHDSHQSNPLQHDHRQARPAAGQQVQVVLIDGLHKSACMDYACARRIPHEQFSK